MNMEKFSFWNEKEYLFNALNIFKVLKVEKKIENFGAGDQK